MSEAEWIAHAREWCFARLARFLEAELAEARRSSEELAQRLKGESFKAILREMKATHGSRPQPRSAPVRAVIGQRRDRRRDRTGGLADDLVEVIVHNWIRARHGELGGLADSETILRRRRGALESYIAWRRERARTFRAAAEMLEGHVGSTDGLASLRPRPQRWDRGTAARLRWHAADEERPANWAQRLLDQIADEVQGRNTAPHNDLIRAVGVALPSLDPPDCARLARGVLSDLGMTVPEQRKAAYIISRDRATGVVRK